MFYFDFKDKLCVSQQRKKKITDKALEKSVVVGAMIPNLGFFRFVYIDFHSISTTLRLKFSFF